MRPVVLVLLVVCTLLICASDGFANGLVLNLGPEEFVEANGVDIVVPGYSVPSFVDWNNDNLNDLVIGEGGGATRGKVRVYLNVGTESNPQFLDYFYAQSGSSDLNCPPVGCMGCFPRVVYWNGDEPNNLKDLLVGQADGTVKIFFNIGTDESPTFDGGTFLQVGQTGAKKNIDVGDRATPTVVDWNGDSRKDLVVGGLDGRIHIFLNGGTDTSPNFFTETFAQASGSPLVVPGQRSSPVVLDLNGDGKKDLLTGNTDGQLLFYNNVATDAAPAFSGYIRVDSNGVPIDLSGTPRSRPFVCDWTGDGYLDVLIGAGDVGGGKVHLYRTMPPGDINKDYAVDFVDFALFAQYWLQTGCGKCGGADLAGSDGNVDINDLQQFTENWLAGVSAP